MRVVEGLLYLILSHSMPGGVGLVCGGGGVSVLGWLVPGGVELVQTSDLPVQSCY